MLESRHLKFSFKKVLIVAACRKFVEIGRALSVRIRSVKSGPRLQVRIFSRRLISATSQPFPTTSKSQLELHVSQIELYAPRARSELTNYAGRAEPD